MCCTSQNLADWLCQYLLQTMCSEWVVLPHIWYDIIEWTVGDLMERSLPSNYPFPLHFVRNHVVNTLVTWLIGGGLCIWAGERLFEKSISLCIVEANRQFVSEHLTYSLEWSHQIHVELKGIDFPRAYSRGTGLCWNDRSLSCELINSQGKVAG